MGEQDDKSVYVEVVVAITWEEGRYSARCLGVGDISCQGDTMVDAVLDLAERLSGHFSAGGSPVDRPDRSKLWQPLPVEMLTALDVAVH
ncbi:hypothetical protein [Nonomuraea wenchangensis]|uniref:HicB_like antitoxin of toxin-antitoxin system n=1 Tax=Nonomuraea wenchangensis TaxID=568860 RepID=A0A1I0LBD4_9ACTN|nr:hypothetical protein [Nonomuraea wenchangensis]SEU37476.1 hypothetical protein SAMN05421811_114219 [Nonomuraea wenchangensis]